MRCSFRLVLLVAVLLLVLPLGCRRGKPSPAPTPLPTPTIAEVSGGTPPAPAATPSPVPVTSSTPPPPRSPSPAPAPVSAPTTPGPTPQPTPSPTPTPGPVAWFSHWKDPAEGAFSLLVPKGWRASGGTQRVNTDPNFTLRMEQGKASCLLSYPAPVQYWEYNAYLEFQGYSEGQTIREYGFVFTLLRYLPAPDYISQLILGELQRQYPDARVQDAQDLPEVALVYREPLATETAAAEAIITFSDSGAPMKAAYTVITDRVVTGSQQGVTWGLWVAKVIGCTAPPADFDQVSRLYSLTLSTVKIDRAWLEAQIRGAAERAEMIRNTFRRIRDMEYRMFQEESESRMRIARGWMNALGGSQDLRDPTTGITYTVPSAPGMNYFWVDRGENIGATLLDQSPGMGLTRLERPP